jgi:inward rectifier potassium channel
MSDGVPTTANLEATPTRDAKLRDDLGIGRIASEAGRGRFLNKNGSFGSQREGLGWLESFSPFHWMLSASWPVFFALAALGFVLVNLVFASLYMVLGDDSLMTSVKMSAFERAFFFSVETLSTIGYGHIVPLSIAAHWLSTLQAFVGVLGVALVTGLLFAKFSKPRSRVLFSQRALIAPFQGGQALMLRLANGMKNEIIELAAQITLSKFETVGGVRSRRFYPLTLERSSVVFMPLSWTLVHPINSASPLWGLTPAELEESAPEFLVVIHAVDDVVYQRITARTSYGAEDMVWNAAFSDIYVRKDDGALRIDVRRLSAYQMLEP